MNLHDALKGRQIKVEDNIKILCNYKMPQSLALVLVPIIFSTKNRIAFLQSPDLRSEVHGF
jgi:hypothetical protein